MDGIAVVVVAGDIADKKADVPTGIVFTKVTVEIAAFDLVLLVVSEGVEVLGCDVVGSQVVANGVVGIEVVVCTIAAVVVGAIVVGTVQPVN